MEAGPQTGLGAGTLEPWTNFWWRITKAELAVQTCSFATMSGSACCAAHLRDLSWTGSTTIGSILLCMTPSPGPTACHSLLSESGPRNHMGRTKGGQMKFLMHKLSLRAWLSGFVVLLAAMVTSVAQEKE